VCHAQKLGGDIDCQSSKDKLSCAAKAVISKNRLIQLNIMMVMATVII
jgi:hypothetical protein